MDVSTADALYGLFNMILVIVSLVMITRSRTRGLHHVWGWYVAAGVSFTINGCFDLADHDHWAFVVLSFACGAAYLVPGVLFWIQHEEVRERLGK